jgi:uncharacterized membrane protein
VEAAVLTALMLELATVVQAEQVVVETVLLQLVIHNLLLVALELQILAEVVEVVLTPQSQLVAKVLAVTVVAA